MSKRTPPPKGEMQYRFAELAKVDSKARTIRFVASDESVDRYGDIIRVSGWDLSNFKTNPVLLFAHQSREPPIGIADAWVDHDKKQLLADATFLPTGVSEFADEVWRIVDAGALKAVSVGFMPTAAPNFIYATDDPGPDDWPTGYEFVGQDLLELSVVPVPANPNALALARSLASASTTRRLFLPDARAAAHVAAEHRRRSITLARLRVGYFNGGSHAQAN